MIVLIPSPFPIIWSVRFKSKTHHLRILASVILSVFVIIYVSAQIDATGSAFEAFMGWNYFLGVFIGFGIVLALHFIWRIYRRGMVRSISRSMLMFLGLILLPIIGFHLVKRGGFALVVVSDRLIPSF